MPKYYRDNKSDKKLIYTIEYPNMEPVIVLPLGQWRELVRLWKERALASYYDDEGCPMGEEWVIGVLAAAEIDNIISSVEVPDAV